MFSKSRLGETCRRQRQSGLSIGNRQSPLKMDTPNFEYEY
jgi:hypothetical protein